MTDPQQPPPTGSERRDLRIEERRLRRINRPPWSWQGATAFVLALTVVVSMTALISGVILYVQSAPLPENIGALITATLSALIGSVAGFLGRASSGSPPEDRGGHADITTPVEQHPPTPPAADVIPDAKLDAEPEAESR
jgi:hypothetical protein